MASNSLITFMSNKYLKYDKSLPFISVTAILAFIGVAIGVMVLIIAMAIMQGMIKEFEDKLFIMNYPLTIKSHYWDNIDQDTVNRLRDRFPNIKFSPYVKAQGVAKSGDIMEGVIVFGVHAESEKKINKVFNKFYKKDKFKKFHIMIGQALQDELYMDKKNKLTIIFTSLEPIGLASTPLMKRFKIGGTFDSGLNAYDKAYVYANIDDLRKILRLNSKAYHGIHAYSKNAQKDAVKIKEFLGDQYSIVGWWQQNSSFFAAMAVEKKALFLVLTLIVLVASLNIITSLLMTVMNRRKEIALLLSLGASKKEIKRIFFRLGSIIGIGGVVAGVVLGLVGLWVLTTFDIISLPKEVYGTATLPLDLSMTDFFSILIGAIMVVLFSSYYPAKKASEIDVLTVLRNE